MLKIFKKNTTGFKILSIDECKSLMDRTEGLVYLDVRTEKEAETDGQLDGSILLDFFKIGSFKKEIESYDREKIYLVYCAIGARSKAAAAIMVKMGFKNVYEMAGGLKAWQKKYSLEDSKMSRLNQEEIKGKKSDIVKRLNRIEGQVRGVKKMVENEDYYPNILNQTLAINSALKSVNKEMMELFLNDCLNEDRNMDDFFNYVKKMMK